MKEILINIIKTFITAGITAVFIIFGMIVVEEINNISKTELQTQAQIEPEKTKKEEGVKVETKEEEKIAKNEIEVPAIIENPLDSLRENAQTQSKTENINYDNITVNKHFYNQLPEYSKTIYKAFEASKEQMKTGTHQIEFGDTFSSILVQEDGQSQISAYYQSAIEAYMYDNPDVFYLAPKKMYLNIETITRGTKTTYNVYINSGEKANYLSDEFSSKVQIDEAISKIEQTRNQILKNKTGDTYKDIKMVHDYLIDTINYDTTISKPYIYNIYGALVEKTSVCEGYAKSMKYLLDYIEIPCTIVIGKGTNSQAKTENHAWNYVQLNGVWYAVDATWDDPIVIGNGTQSQASRYKYFLKGSIEMDKDHIPSGKFTENGMAFNYPTLNSSCYF